MWLSADASAGCPPLQAVKPQWLVSTTIRSTLARAIYVRPTQFDLATAGASFRQRDLLK